MKGPVLARRILTTVLAALALAAPAFAQPSMALKRKRDATVIEMPGLNHMFQAAKKGSIMEIAQIEEALDRAALKVIGDWVVAKK